MRMRTVEWFRVVKVVATCGFVLGVLHPAAVLARGPQKKGVLRVEAETLAEGKWKSVKTSNASGGEYLHANASAGPLKTSIKLPRMGKYHVWVRLWNGGHKHRRGRVTVNGEVSSVLGEERHLYGWNWYKLGAYNCDKLNLVLEALNAAPADVWFDTFYITESLEPPGQVIIGSNKPVWIWSKKETPDDSTVYFRKDFLQAGKAREGKVYVRAGGAYVIYINGREVGKGDSWKDFAEYDITPYLLVGKNVLAVSCRRGDGPGALLLKAAIKPVSGKEISLRSSHEFRVSRKEQNGWNRRSFDDSAWWGAKEFTINRLRKFTVSEK